MLNSSNENLEKKPTLQNNTVENTTFIELDDSYYDQANIYVKPNYAPVSYTHLDVYKRQLQYSLTKLKNKIQSPKDLCN